MNIFQEIKFLHFFKNFLYSLLNTFYLLLSTFFMTLFSFELFGHTFSASFYGLMYAVAFIVGFWILKQKKIFTEKQLDDLFIFIVLGVVLGGRIGYILFYNFSYYLEYPLQMLAFWNGWMSFHGGLLGVILASFLFSKKYKINFLKITDMLAFLAPIWLFFYRNIILFSTLLKNHKMFWLIT